jgi:hypothetical protein
MRRWETWDTRTELPQLSSFLTSAVGGRALSQCEHWGVALEDFWTETEADTEQTDDVWVAFVQQSFEPENRARWRKAR